MMNCKKTLLFRFVTFMARQERVDEGTSFFFFSSTESDLLGLNYHVRVRTFNFDAFIYIEVTQTNKQK